MNHRLWLIFLSSIICYHASTTAFYGERTCATMCEKIKKAYLITYKKTGKVYDKAKKHKKLVAGVAVYLVFECAGYAQEWDTPFRRLITPARLLQQARANIQGLTTQIANLTRAHHQALEQQQSDYAQELEDQRLQAPQQQPEDLQELQTRCEELENQLQDLQARYDGELRLKKRMQEVTQEMINFNPSSPFYQKQSTAQTNNKTSTDEGVENK